MSSDSFLLDRFLGGVTATSLSELLFRGETLFRDFRDFDEIFEDSFFRGEGDRLRSFERSDLSDLRDLLLKFKASIIPVKFTN